MPEINWKEVLQQRPDVAAEYTRANAGGGPNPAWAPQGGATNTPEGFAEWWYTKNKPAEDTYTYAPPQAPTTTAGTGAGATTTPGGNRDVARQQATLRARMTFINQGLNPDQYMPELDSYINDIYNVIPAGETNAGSFFDPNFAQNFLNGKNQQARRGNSNFVRSALRKPSIDYTSLDATISKLLGTGLKEGQDYLDRGKQRGQFNEAGYAAGRTKLDGAKSKAQAKLKGYASDIFGKYSSKFDDIYARADAAANNSDANSGFDISPFTDEYNRLSERTKGDGLEGELLSLTGDQPLVDLGSLRGGVAQGQGSVNLQDLDVLDGLAKRKQANAAGRGIGSQGTF